MKYLKTLKFSISKETGGTTDSVYLLIKDIRFVWSLMNQQRSLCIYFPEVCLIIGGKRGVNRLGVFSRQSYFNLRKSVGGLDLPEVFKGSVWDFHFKYRLSKISAFS